MRRRSLREKKIELLFNRHFEFKTNLENFQDNKKSFREKNSIKKITLIDKKNEKAILSKDTDSNLSRCKYFNK